MSGRMSQFRGLTLCAAMFLASTGAVSGQTLKDAAFSNMALGLKLCLSGNGDMRAWTNMFLRAGFAERVERSQYNSDTTHFFTAPANTAIVELYYGEMPEECSVTSTLLGVSDASRVLDWVVPKIYPGFVRKLAQGPINPSTGQPAQCVRYEDPANAIGLAIAAAPGGNASSACIENGVSRLISFYRV